MFYSGFYWPLPGKITARSKITNKYVGMIHFLYI
jgi:hypothetical protein